MGVGVGVASGRIILVIVVSGSRTCVSVVAKVVCPLVIVVVNVRTVVVDVRVVVVVLVDCCEALSAEAERI